MSALSQSYFTGEMLTYGIPINLLMLGILFHLAIMLIPPMVAWALYARDSRRARRTGPLAEVVHLHELRAGERPASEEPRRAA